jgi:hypothetical protein
MATLKETKEREADLVNRFQHVEVRPLRLAQLGSNSPPALRSLRPLRRSLVLCSSVLSRRRRELIGSSAGRFALASARERRSDAGPLLLGRNSPRLISRSKHNCRSTPDERVSSRVNGVGKERALSSTQAGRTRSWDQVRALLLVGHCWSHGRSCP